jgi:L-ascorbate metabolism protein UlaG (beta-lactamase superfamily)
MLRACAIILAVGCMAQASSVRVTYLANEGVLIDGAGTKILIDALFRDSLGYYVRHSPALQEPLETGKPPFDGVRLALATHFHLDHWDAGAISRFLRSNPAARFGSTPDATAMMPSSQRPRVLSFAGRERLEVGGAVIDVVPLEHGRTQNIGYRITLAGVSLIHLGDAEATDRNFRALLDSGNVDVAMVPWWWTIDPKALAFMRDQWKPRKLVAFHVGTEDLPSVPKVEAAWPGVWVCTKPGDHRKY